MIKYSLCAPNDGDTMTVSGGGGWSSPVGDDRKGGGGSDKDSRDSQVDFSKNPEKQAVVNPYLAVAVPMTVYPINGTWGFTINTAVIDTGLGKISSLLSEALPVAGRLLGFTAGALWPSSIAPDSIDPAFNKMQQEKLAQLAAKQGVLNKGYNVTTLPANLVTGLSVSQIGKQPTAPANVLAQAVIDPALSKRQLTVTRAAINAPVANIPVVKAEKTKVSGVFSAKILAGEPAFQIKLENTRAAQAKNPPKVRDNPAVSSFLSTPAPDTHHAFVDFGSDHEPVYVSVSKIVTAEEEKKQVEEAKKREQEWLKKHPEAVAERELAERVKDVSDAKTNRDNINAQIASLNEKILDAKRQIEGVKREQEAAPISKALPEEEALFIYSAAESYINKLSAQIAQEKNELVKAEQAITHAEQRRKDAEKKAKDENEKKRNGVKDKGHQYHPEPKIEEINGLGELKPGKKKTPKQGGAGKRARWIGDKGNKIYEWDSQHGELEGYRASDGQHLGAFDPKTGKQLKPADPKRNIKKYL
ncbi:colicin-like bacteriocin tRNase domain-containing protein [Brenneria corticis]|uniref:colicin-like bacteriocin tRNase domain-containing protein n=1 Tax=Brenneria corticis TaxID=2173106 RepID=UPI00143D13B8|nr:colicin-like bacteriocin tRNase domain-containing protein [Brenneria sp. CFCC 11842]